MKKQIKDYDNYYIYDDGSVFNGNTNKMLEGSINEGGYRYYRLSKNGKKQMFYAHRLVAEHFVDNPNNLPVVNHKDGNKLNNTAENLEWVSYAQNAEHFHQHIKTKQPAKKQNKFEESLPGEVWVATNGNPNYEVSNFARVKNIKTNTLLRPSITNGYYKVRLSYNGKVTDWMLYKLVYFSFNKEENMVGKCIDHIDANKLNDNLDNLRLITLSENVNAAYYTQKTNSSIKAVSQYDKLGNLLNTFPSIREAGRQLGLDGSSITKCCKGKVLSVGGFVFQYT